MPGPVTEGVVKQEGREGAQVQGAIPAGGGGGLYNIPSLRQRGMVADPLNPDENTKKLTQLLRAQQAQKKAKIKSPEAQSGGSMREYNAKLKQLNDEQLKKELSELQNEIEKLRKQIQKNSKDSKDKATNRALANLTRDAANARKELQNIATTQVERQLQIANWLTPEQKQPATGGTAEPATRKEGRIETSEELFNKIQDNPYLLHATEFTTPYIYNVTNLTDNFRLYNGDIEEITMGNGHIQHGYDTGKGSANMMRMLYPSTGGTLATGGGRLGDRLKKDCEPTPELMAEIIGHLHQYRENKRKSLKDVDESILKEIQEVYQTTKNSKQQQNIKNNLYKKYFLYQDIHEIVTKNKEEKTKVDEDLDQAIRTGLDEKIAEQKKYYCKPFYTGNDIPEQGSFTNQSVSDIENRYSKERIKEAIEFAKEFPSLQKGFRTLVSFIKYAEEMIDEENTSEEDESNILPQYTTEQMIMTYVMKEFSSINAMERFYDTVREKIPSETFDANSELTEKQNQLKDRMKVFEGVHGPKSTPFPADCFSTASTNILKVETEGNGEKTASFTSNTFSDCVDTATRNWMNYLAYDADDATNEWNKVYGENEKTGLERKCREVRDALQERKQTRIPYYDLQTRIKLYFYYQKQFPEEAKGQEGHRFWNYVVSNMNQEREEDKQYYYDIEYCKGTNELQTGYANLLKVLYNLSYALNGSSGSDSGADSKFQAAKEKIDALQGSTGNVENTCLEAVEAIFALYDQEGMNIDVDSSEPIRRDNDRIIGNIIIQLKNQLKFQSRVFDKHSEVQDQSITVELDNDAIGKMQDDRTLGLLQGKQQNENKLYHPGSDDSVFHQLYGDPDVQLEHPSYEFIRAFLQNETHSGENSTSKHYQRWRSLMAEKLLRNNALRWDEEKIQLFSTLQKGTISVNKSGEEAGKEDLAVYFLRNYANGRIVKGLLAQGQTQLVESAFLSVKQGKNTYYYSKNGQHAKIVYADIQDKNAEIPATVTVGDTVYTVTEIGDWAFSGCSALETVNLQNVTEIGENAFVVCSALKNVVLPNVTTIENSAFSRCRALTAVTLQRAQTIGEYAFSECSELQTVGLPNAAMIGNSAFSDCSALETVTLRRAQTIGEDAFFGCKALTTVDLPNAAMIGNSAFSDCSALETVDLPNVTTIGAGAFSGCSALETVDLQNVTEIGASVFFGCRALTTATLRRAQTIGERAFSDCSALETVTLQNAAMIGNSAFSNCSALQSVDLQKAQTIGESVFLNCRALKEVVLPKAQTIGDWAFYGCTRLKRGTIQVSEPMKRKILSQIGNSNSDSISSDSDSDSSWCDSDLYYWFL